MFSVSIKWGLLALLLIPIISVFESKVSHVLAEDEVEEEINNEDDASVADEGTGSEIEETGEEGPPEDIGIKGSPDADTVVLFIKPVGDGTELPGGKLVEFLVGFTNNGDNDFILDSIDASFRYPMDFSFYIQNFTAIPYQRTVKPKHEATLIYSFYPAEAFAGRPLGLSVILAYHNADGEGFLEAVFNKTVNIMEVDEGLDGETFFLYVFLLAFSILLLLAGHHFLSSFGRKKGSTTKKPHVEMGTNIKDGIDYDWIPKELLNDIKKNNPPRQSPKQRKIKSSR